MARLINSRINKIFETKVVQLTRDLSLRSKCIIVSTTNSTCPNCIFDAVTKASSGKYRAGGPKPFSGKVCPVCNAKGTIATEKRLQIPANVRWGVRQQDPNVPMPEGFVPVGFIKIKAEFKYFALLTNAAYFIIDGTRCSRYGEPKKRGLQNYVICEQLVQIDK